MSPLLLWLRVAWSTWQFKDHLTKVSVSKEDGKLQRLQKASMALMQEKEFVKSLMISKGTRVYWVFAFKKLTRGSSINGFTFHSELILFQEVIILYQCWRSGCEDRPWKYMSKSGHWSTRNGNCCQYSAWNDCDCCIYSASNHETKASFQFLPTELYQVVRNKN